MLVGIHSCSFTFCVYNLGALYQLVTLGNYQLQNLFHNRSQHSLTGSVSQCVALLTVCIVGSELGLGGGGIWLVYGSSTLE